MRGATDPRPLVVHVVYRFDVGGLENGVVNLVNRMDRNAYRHAIVALTEVTGYRQRVTRNDVPFVPLHKPPGHGYVLYPALFRLFRAQKPAIVHTRNLAALEAAVPAFAAGVPVRIHGEHGRDVEDYDGNRRKYQWIRRAYRPFVSHYVALSRDLEGYLRRRVGVPAGKVTQIYNGVDLDRFRVGPRQPAPDDPFASQAVFRIGWVGRMQAVKDPLNLVRAFLRVRELVPAARTDLRLVMVGDGPLLAQVRSLLGSADAHDAAWLAGERNDVPAVLGSLDSFVLPSRAEGISNTILEAMACGVPVIATDVGGNAELVVDDVTGALVPAGDPEALARQIARFWSDRDAARRAGAAGRARVQAQFALDAMVRRYQGLYDGLLRTKAAPAVARGAG
ncbi:MAG: TIGR03088 family PEP-CTERM/XrtA system glycosyltransferase [Burkholderiales bacterium]|nr:TIGR03088 family PEP-CTERM/XrtA system glycosyltransferase [Burkholderiales bacterium]